MGLRDPLDGGEFVAQEGAVGGHVGDADFDQIVEAAGHHMGLLDLIQAADGVGEDLEDVLGGAVQAHLDKGRQRPVQQFRVQQGHVLADEAIAFQPAHPFQAGRGRQVHPSRQFDIRDTPIFLQNAQDVLVDTVQLRSCGIIAHYILWPKRDLAG